MQCQHGPCQIGCQAWPVEQPAQPLRQQVSLWRTSVLLLFVELTSPDMLSFVQVTATNAANLTTSIRTLPVTVTKPG